ncbi:MAG: hypothetical protein EOM17_11120 [Synergistales bacterium]|nr:hypothetical protein [Synergistales bacterium]
MAEPGKRAFKALVVVFGSQVEELVHAIEDRLFALLKTFERLDPEKQWVMLDGEGSPSIPVCQVKDNILSQSAFEGYDYFFLAGDLNSASAETARKILRDEFVRAPFAMAFLLPTKDFEPRKLSQHECQIVHDGHTRLDGEFIASFIRDYCAMEIFPNQISVDFADYRFIEGSKVQAKYVAFDPYTPCFSGEFMVRPKALLAIVFISPEHQDITLSIASDIGISLEQRIGQDFFFTDVAYLPQNIILCLYP